MKKKATLVLAVASLLLCSPLAMAETTDSKAIVQAKDVLPPYHDISGHFAQQAITNLTYTGIVSSYTKIHFAPNEKVKRADFQTWLEKLTTVKVAGENTDHEGITRIEAALWIAEAVGLADGSGKPEFLYTDTTDIKPEQQRLLYHLSTLKVMVGDGNGQFRPNQTLTRGEAAVLLDRVNQQVLPQGQEQLPFRDITAELPETAYTMVQENKTAAGLFSAIEGNQRYLMASMGEKPTTGYSISIIEIYESERGVFVKVKENRPGPREPVGEAITYPYTVVKIKDTTKPIYLIKAK